MAKVVKTNALKNFTTLKSLRRIVGFHDEPLTFQHALRTNERRQSLLHSVEIFSELTLHHSQLQLKKQAHFLS
jgi:hypothetical protein